MEYDASTFSKPLIISGPCSAETREQVLTTAGALKGTGKVHMLRAGIWKPRTKPGNFEGIGEPGLEWLVEAGNETGLPVMVEVGNPKHVEQILKYGIKHVWIGARTTVNPFYVQELAESLKNTGVQVFIKNPLNPDVDLWAGAAERFLHIDITPGLIHRGFALYGNDAFRNPPMWNVPLEMMRRFPDLRMICDPSHICGNRSGLKNIAQTAIDLGMNGLIIESHVDPDNAWSDARQQITPFTLKQLLDELIWRKPSVVSDKELNGLTELRSRIDALDSKMLNLLSERMQLADQIGAFKKENNITIVQMERFNEILMAGLHASNQLGLSEQFIRSYFEVIHMESIEHQNSVMND
jgi:chorismate mutase